jgi:hypothetical protein
MATSVTLKVAWDGSVLHPVDNRAGPWIPEGR